MSRILRVFFATILAGAICSHCQAGNFSVRLVAQPQTLQIGHRGIIQIWGWADDFAADANNGINVWQFDLLVEPNSTGVVVIPQTDDINSVITIYSPVPFDSDLLPMISINNPSPGDIHLLGATTLESPQDSNCGVGGYSLLAEVVVEANSAGIVSYSANGLQQDFYAILRDGQYLNGIFDRFESPATITIIDSPVLMADFNGDGIVSTLDMQEIMSSWLAEEPGLTADIAPDGGDGRVDIYDFIEFSGEWQPVYYKADLNADGIIDFIDFAKVAEAINTGTNLVDIAPGQGDGITNIHDLLEIINHWLEFSYR